MKLRSLLPLVLASLPLILNAQPPAAPSPIINPAQSVLFFPFESKGAALVSV